jgi:hypothetical protein
VLLPSCALFEPSVEGTWRGVCETRSKNMQIELKLKEKEDGKVRGEATISWSRERHPILFEGKARGRLTDGELEMRLVAEDEVRELLVEVDADVVDGNHIEGDCDADGDDGDLELKRIE